MIARDSEGFAMDLYADIRPGLSPEFAGLAADELAVALGPVPASLVLHRLLNTAELNAVLSVLQGHSSRRSGANQRSRRFDSRVSANAGAPV